MEDKTWTNKKVDRFIVVNQKLGKGAFGIVYKGFFAEDESKIVAAKAISIKSLSESSKMLDLIKREIGILQKIQNLNIVKLYDVARTPHNLYMFLEYCQDGDLKEYIKAKDDKKLSEQEATLFLSHIIDGFRELYSKNIIHRDIKPANIMLHNNHAKISDFGFARMLDKMDQTDFYSRLGSPLYMSPQILEAQPFNSKCDVWSVGVVYYEMLYGKTPWIAENQNKLLSSIKKDPLIIPESPPRSQKVKILLQNMLKVSEEERWSWPQVFEYNLTEKSGPQLVLKMNNQLNAMEESVAMNNNYIQKRLVAGYLDQKDENHNSEPRQPMQESDEKNVNKSSSDLATKQSVFQDSSASQVSRVILRIEEDDKMRKNLLKINEYLLFERNISFFYNFAIQKLITGFSTQALKLDTDLFFRLVFLICKNQNINLQRIHQLLNCKEQNEFNNTLWRKYQESLDFQKTLKLISNDIAHSSRFYQDLLNKTQEVIKNNSKSNSNEEKRNLEEFSKVMNMNFEFSNEFKNQYLTVLNEIQKKLDLQLDGLEVQGLIIFKFLLICKNPYDQFTNSSFDFNRFYEEHENKTLEQLKTEIEQKMG